MTIFRYSGFIVSLLATACGSVQNNYPDADTPLGRIVRISNFEQASDELKRFTEAGLRHPDELRTAFLRAGFVPSIFRNERGVDCQSFQWVSNDVFPIVMLVSICNREVIANAGQRAP
jgi:hypothetical protein